MCFVHDPPLLGDIEPSLARKWEVTLFDVFSYRTLALFVTDPPKTNLNVDPSDFTQYSKENPNALQYVVFIAVNIVLDPKKGGM